MQLKSIENFGQPAKNFINNIEIFAKENLVLTVQSVVEEDGFGKVKIKIDVVGNWQKSEINSAVIQIGYLDSSNYLAWKNSAVLSTSNVMKPAIWNNDISEQTLVFSFLKNEDATYFKLRLAIYFNSNSPHKDYTNEYEINILPHTTQNAINIIIE